VKLPIRLVESDRGSRSIMDANDDTVIEGLYPVWSVGDLNLIVESTNEMDTLRLKYQMAVDTIRAIVHICCEKRIFKKVDTSVLQSILDRISELNESVGKLKSTEKA